MAHLTVTLSEQDQVLLHSIAAATKQSCEAVASAALKNYVQWQIKCIRRAKAGLQAGPGWRSNGSQ